MYEINQEQFGIFLSQLRKQKGYTQKQLAEKVFVSDKAVSKWERGISLPDIALLKPLADILGVTVTELLQGQYINEDKTMTKKEVEELVSGSIGLSVKEREKKRANLKKHVFIYVLCILAVFTEVSVLIYMGFAKQELLDDVYLVIFLNLFLGGWFLFFVKETLPAYYDENKISFYSQGTFRINLAGVHFNNNNWTHILRAGRIWTLGTAVLYPVIYPVLRGIINPYAWNKYKVFVILIFALSIFIPMIIAGKRYE